MPYIDLDVCFEEPTETIEDAMEDLTQGLAVNAIVLNEETLNGWPIVRFIGSRTDLETVVGWYLGDDIDDATLVDTIDMIQEDK